MKIWYISDLHLDFWIRHLYSTRDKRLHYVDVIPQNVDYFIMQNLDPQLFFDCSQIKKEDVIVLAGDISNKRFISELFVDNIRKICNVVYVHGNHDFYSEKEKPTEEDTNFIYEFGGIKFIASTFWTNFRDIEHSAIFAEKAINDFRNNSKFNADDCKRLNKSSIEFIRKNADKKSIVVTHFPPSRGSEHPRYAGDILNHYFVNDMDDLVKEISPIAWIHGHVHDPWRYRIGKTWILCNPLGYPKENTSIIPVIPKLFDYNEVDINTF